MPLLRVVWASAPGTAEVSAQNAEGVVGDRARSPTREREGEAPR